MTRHPGGNRADRPAIGTLGGMNRRALVIAVVGVVIVAGGGAWWGVAHYAAGPGPECTVPRPAGPTSGGSAVAGLASASSATTGSAADDPLAIDAVQLQHAATINAVGLARGESEQARVIAVATAWQESSLRNIEHGDRDSLGLFQQRPSQGWGKPAELMDPVYAAGAFYDALARVRSWQELSLTEAAQAVQRSAYPDAYAKWEGDAQALVTQLSGEVTVALTCRAGAAGSTAEEPQRPAAEGSAGADPRLADLLAAAAAEFGAITISPIPAGAHEATVTGAVPGRPAAVAGRALAGWFVAHTASFGVDEVAVAGRLWSGHRWTETDQELPPGTVTVRLAAS